MEDEVLKGDLSVSGEVPPRMGEENAIVFRRQRLFQKLPDVILYLRRNWTVAVHGQLYHEFLNSSHFN